MRSHCYQIIVSAQLGEIDREEFEDLRIERYGVDTALVGELDQPGLSGVIERIVASDLQLKELSLLAGEMS